MNALKLIACSLACLAACSVSPSLFGDTDNDRLKVGSRAPELDIEHWVSDGDGKFKPINKFKSGNVYVVEFWATWCPPCVASMPHLSKLQRKYADKGLQIISISDEDLETVQSFLEQNVRGQSSTTYAELTANYCLTTDPDSSSQVDYLEAARQDGIPAAFIIGRDGVIEWIGHPMEMDQPLEQVINDKWDRVAYLKQKEEEEKAIADIEKRVRSALRKMRNGESDEAINMLDAVIADYKTHPAIDQLKGLRFQMVLSTGGERAAVALNEFAADIKDPEMLNEIAWTVVEMKMNGENAGDELVKAAAKIASSALNTRPNDAAILDTLAHLTYFGGDLDEAIKIQQKAVANAGPLKAEVEPYLEFLQKQKAARQRESQKESDK